MDQHRRGQSGFTGRYRIGKLIYVEAGEDVGGALDRERQIKGWTRAKKLALIRTLNPSLRDMTDQGYYWRHILEAYRAQPRRCRDAPIRGVPNGFASRKFR